MKRRRTILYARVSLVPFTPKACRDTLHRNCGFHPVGSADHVVHSTVSGARNIDALFFIPGWDHCGFHKKCDRTRYTEHVFLHSVGSAGHFVVPPRREMMMHYFLCAAWTGMDSTKRAGTRYAELVFLHPVSSVGHIVHSGASGCEMSAHYFHARVRLVRLHQKHLGTRHMELVFLHLMGSAGHVVHFGLSHA
jgi:hypothetical protein